MIIEAKQEHYKELAKAMKGFEQASKFVKVDVDYVIKRFGKLIDSGTGKAFLLLEDNKIIGSLGCIKVPDFWNGDLIAIEMFWFVDPAHRGQGLKLFKTFEDWARREGCKKIAMIHMEDSYPEILTKLYHRWGYKLLERHYIKEIKL